MYGEYYVINGFLSRARGEEFLSLLRALKLDMMLLITSSLKTSS